MICKKTIQAISGTTLFRYLRIWLKANTAIVISGFIVVSFLSFSVFQIVSLNETVMDTLEENGYKSYEAEIKSKVEWLIKELDELDRVYSKTDLTKSQKRELMLDFVGSKNFSDDNEEYFFVLKSDGSVLLSLLVQDGSKSGENAIALKDKNGKEYVKDIVQKASGGGGYVRYKLPKVGSPNQTDKLSYVKGYPKYDIIVGSGVYMDDVKNSIKKQRDKLFNQTVIHATLILLSLSAFFVFLVYKIFESTKRKIESQLETAREMLKKEEDLKIFKQAIESTRNGVIITSSKADDTRAIYVNKMFTEITGYGKSDIIGQNCRILNEGTSDPQTKQIIKQAIEESKSVKATIKNRKKDGTLFYNDLFISPIFMDEDSDAKYFVGVQNDVTESVYLRDELEKRVLEIEKLKDSAELKLKKLFDASSEAIFFIKAENNFEKMRFLDANEEACRLTGYTKQELLSMHPRRLYRTAKDRELLERFATKLLWDKRGSAEYQITTKTKETIDIYLSSAVIEIGDERVVMAIAHDISEQKRLSRELEAAKEALEEAQRISKTGNYEINLIKNEVVISKELERIFELPKKESYPMEDFISMIADEDEERVIAAMARAVNNGALIDESFKITTKKGAVKHIKTIMQPKADDKNIIFGITQDITEQTLIQSRQKEQEALLIRQGRLSAMGEMIGNIAHQWRQPLNALGIMIQDVRFAYDEGELGRKYIDEFVDDSMKQIGFMSKIIDDFRSFFSPDSQKGDFLPKRGIEGALLVITPELLKYGIKVYTDIEYEKSIVGYEKEFKQILLALLTNSKDAIVENVSIKREISISLKEDGDFVVVSVEDTGGGIDEGVSHRIFEPYFSTKPQGKGVGIALYMAKQVIDRHLGGDISFFNTGCGVCFTVRLPKHGEAVR